MPFFNRGWQKEKEARSITRTIEERRVEVSVENFHQQTEQDKLPRLTLTLALTLTLLLNLKRQNLFAAAIVEEILHGLRAE